MAEKDLGKLLEQAGNVLTEPEIAQELGGALREAGLSMTIPDILEMSGEIAAQTTDRAEVADLIKQIIEGAKA